MNVVQRLTENAELLYPLLCHYTAEGDADFDVEREAERYSLLAKGKRIRPTLVLEFCRLFGGADAAALPFAVAVEMVHTYSLIHDDLPCMDNDDMRRGRPTCHKAFDEATALLAGDGLLTRAFGVLADNTAVTAEAVRDAVCVLSQAAGPMGMIGGQVMDLAGERKRLSLDALQKLHAHKTGALIAAAAELGCLAAGLKRNDPRTEAAVRYAKGIGLAFQIVDDVLDVTADAAVLGKNIGSDARCQKTTFLSYFNAEDALVYAEQVTAQAKAELEGIVGSAFLLHLADHLLNRKS